MRYRCWIFAATILLTPALASTDAGLSDPIATWKDDPSVDCKGPRTTVEIAVCAGRSYKTSYLALVALYNQLYAIYSPANKRRLQMTQRSWHRFLADECDFETAATMGGTIHAATLLDCRTKLTEARLKQLQTQLSCTDGDMSCNKP